MTDVLNNLIAEAIGLAVGLFFTYVIVDTLLRRRDRSRWRSAHEALLSKLKRTSEMALLLWSYIARPSLIPSSMVLDSATFSSIAKELDGDLQELKRKGPLVVVERPGDYWIQAAKSLTSLNEQLQRAADRAEFALKDRPDLVQLLSDLEDGHVRLQAFVGADEYDPKPALPTIAYQVVRVFDLHVRLWNALPGVAGIIESRPA